MNISSRNIYFILALAVPIFLLVQLFERLFLFSQVVSPAYLALFPALFTILALHKLATVEGIQRPERGQVAFILLCAVLIVILMLQKLILPVRFDYFGRSSVDFASYVGTYALTWGLIGFSIANIRVEKNEKVAIALMVVVGFLVFRNAASGYVNFSDLREQTGIDSLSHLWVSENIVMLFFLSYALARSYWVKLLLFVVVALCLVAMLGRSSLFFSIIAVALFELAFGSARHVSLRVFGALGVALLFLLIMLGVQVYSSDDVFDRVFLRGGLGGDASFTERMHFMKIGLQYLDMQLWIGGPDILAEQFGHLGAYIHNILSAWQFFGFPFFFMLCIALLHSIFRMRFVMRNSERSVVTDFGALLLIYATVCVLFTKTSFYWGFWLAIGLWHGVRLKRSSE